MSQSWFDTLLIALATPGAVMWVAGFWLLVIQQNKKISLSVMLTGGGMFAIMIILVTSVTLGAGMHYAITEPFSIKSAAAGLTCGLSIFSVIAVILAGLSELFVTPRVEAALAKGR